MHCNHSHHQTPEEPGNISSVICSQSHSLKLSRIWNQFLKTAHEIKGLVQRKTGNQPVMETKTREGFWTDLGTRMQIPSRFGFPDLVVPMCRQEMVKRSVHYKMLLQALPHSLLLRPFPQPWAHCSSQGVRGEATPHHLWRGKGQDHQHSMQPKSSLKSSHHKGDLDREDRFLGWLFP